MSAHDHNRFVPAAGFRAFSALYDPVLTWLLRGRAWKGRLVEQVGPKPGERILDLGSGTGSLTVMLQQSCPGALVVGVDIDREMLMRARRKAQAAGLNITFRRRAVDSLGLPASLGYAQFDKAVSSLLFHHLSDDAKARTMRNASALLRPGGELHIADWGRPNGPLMRTLFYPVQLLDGFANTSANVRGLLPEMMQEAGFEAVRETHREPTAFGLLSFYAGTRS